MAGLDYVNSMDRAYFSDLDSDLNTPEPSVYGGSSFYGNFAEEDANKNQPLIRISELGQTIAEGPRLGSLMDQEIAAIKRGVRSIELQTMPEGSGAPPGMGGSESYGKTIREELRKLAEFNNVNITSVHAPPQIGNLTGLTQGGFNDAEREREVTEIKKAIDFAADVGAGAIVVHTGEFPRPIYDA
ncbi:MAG: TIM barrel protein, partial [Nitrospiraceae bacterium]|nr:TIM barrel protein [Nitrospiraceae bacterium]